MNDITQLPLFAQEHPIASRHLIYIPPTLEDVNQYAHAVCQELAQHMNTAPPDAEIMRGFAAFIRAAVSTHVNYLNRANNQLLGEIDATQKAC